MRLLTEPFAAPFMQRALLEIAVVSLAAGVVGTFLHLRRLSFSADALTHTIFPGVAIAFYAGASVFIGALIAAVASAALLTLATTTKRIDEDGFLALLVATFFSVGVIVVSRGRTFNADLTSLLFGRLLTVDAGTILQSGAVVGVVLVVSVVVGKDLVFRAFDPDGAAAAGYRGWGLDLVLHLLMALVVVAAARAIGTALVVALLIVPAAAARLVCDRVATTMLVATGCSAGAGVIGLALAWEASVHHDVNLAAGPTVITTNVMVFLVCAAAAGWRHRRGVKPRPEPMPA